MSLQRGINLRALAEKMGQCSGAEVRGICTEAGTYRRMCLIPSLTLWLRYVRTERTAAACDTGGLRVRHRKGSEEEPGRQHFGQQALLVIYSVPWLVYIISLILSFTTSSVGPDSPVFLDCLDLPSSGSYRIPA